MSASLPNDEVDRLARRINELPGIREFDVSGLPDVVTLRCDANGSAELASAAVHSILRTETGGDTEVRVELIDPPAGRPGIRARFESLETSVPEPGRLSARVVLSWSGVDYTGEATAELSPAGELRASANAALQALEAVVGESAVFTLIGVKELYVFDHNVVAVLVYSPHFPNRRLVGLSIITEDRQTSAALAVLNATNRSLGSLGRPPGGSVDE